jgi:uncharacterized protein with ATP-grasp and redox domains
LFVSEFKNAKKILYLADNAGEIVLDKLFIDQIIKAGKELVLAVKSGPILNDVTREDIIDIGFDDRIRIIETGDRHIGINFKNISKELREDLEDSDIIISKGQGNFESLDKLKGKKIFFLVKVKCELIGRELGVGKMDVVFKKNKYYQ